MAKRKKSTPKKPNQSKLTSVSAVPATHRPFRQLRSRGDGPKRPPTPKAAPVPAEETLGSDSVELRSFAEHMHGVEAFPDGPRRLPRTVSSLEPPSDRRRPAEDPDVEARAALIRLVTDGIRFDVMDDGAVLEGRRIDVDPREIRRLRRQAYPVDGTLDLHGRTLEEARGAVAAFVRARRIQGDRAVLVVHGRGRHSPGGQPVLRGELAAWLSQGSAARDVAAFSSVPDGRDGSSGAVFVLLSR